MPNARVADSRIELTRSDEEKRPLVQRLTRIEGQIRGLRAMIEQDRYCLDEVQQINAATAALREVALLIISQHVYEAASLAQEPRKEPDQRAVAVDDMMQVLRAAMRLRD